MNSKTISRPTELAYMALMAALMAVCAWISIPASPPFTMQTFAVFAAAGLLGLRRGLISLSVYILLGLIGLPVFSNMTGGVGVLLGSTGGYMVGFVFIALIEGFVADRTQNAGAIFAAMVLGTAVCYAFGTAWYMHIYTAQSGPIGLTTVLGWCVLPFIIPDLAKMALALALIRRLRPHLRLD